MVNRSFIWFGLVGLMWMSACNDTESSKDENDSDCIGDNCTGGDGDTDSDTDSDTDNDTDSDTDSDTDTDADSDADTDSDTDQTPRDYPTNIFDSCKDAPALRQSASDIIAASNKFGINLFKKVLDRADGQNVSISPISLHTVWSMLYNGVRDEAATELKSALALDDMELSAVNEGYRELLTAIGTQDEEVTVEQADSIWISNTYADLVVPEFLQQSETTFDAGATVLDFGAETAADTINGWVKDNTGGHIDNLVESPIGPDVAMYLIDALYFAAPWTFQFDPEATTTEAFTTLDGQSKDVEMMHIEAGIRYYEDENIQMVEIPYAWGIYAMSIILPKEGVDMTDVVAGMSPETFQSQLDASRIYEVTLSLPKFEVAFDAINGDSKEFVNALKDLGINLVFEPSANYLSGVIEAAPDMPANVSDVKQKTYLKVQEDGAEAAAASMIEISITIDGGGTPSKTMTVNRPFLYTIHDRCQDGILFLGRITDPPPVSE
jgi:serpin B